jgi:hypothetical protein
MGIQVAALLAELEEATEMLRIALAEDLKSDSEDGGETNPLERESGGSV